MPATVLQDELFNHRIGQLGIAVWTSAFLLQPGGSTLLVSPQVLMTGLAADCEVVAQLRDGVFSTLC